MTRLEHPECPDAPPSPPFKFQTSWIAWIFIGQLPTFPRIKASKADMEPKKSPSLLNSWLISDKNVIPKK
jgi:hypothetical protein